MEGLLRWCSVCSAETEVDVVPCPDGHGADCPDVVCARCGVVAVIGLVSDAAEPRRAAGAA
ncbi:MAG: hypothetical protein ACTHOD_10225 [Motilibacteraceae bacterium]